MSKETMLCTFSSQVLSFYLFLFILWFWFLLSWGLLRTRYLICLFSATLVALSFLDTYLAREIFMVLNPSRWGKPLMMMLIYLF